MITNLTYQLIIKVLIRSNSCDLHQKMSQTELFWLSYDSSKSENFMKMTKKTVIITNISAESSIQLIWYLPHFKSTQDGIICTKNCAEQTYLDVVMMVWSFLILVYLYPFVQKCTQKMKFWILKANE